MEGPPGCARSRVLLVDAEGVGVFAGSCARLVAGDGANINGT